MVAGQGWVLGCVCVCVYALLAKDQEHKIQQLVVFALSQELGGVG